MLPRRKGVYRKNRNVVIISILISGRGFCKGSRLLPVNEKRHIRIPIRAYHALCKYTNHVYSGACIKMVLSAHRTKQRMRSVPLNDTLAVSGTFGKIPVMRLKVPSWNVPLKALFVSGFAVHVEHGATALLVFHSPEGR
jgi:hypothetical protein